MTEPANAINQYVCDVCGFTITTVCELEGVTPMFVGCRSQSFTERCKGKMVSRMYRVDQSLPADWAWYKPTLKAAKRMGADTLDHVKRGGLLLRKRDAYEYADVRRG